MSAQQSGPAVVVGAALALLAFLAPAPVLATKPEPLSKDVPLGRELAAPIDALARGERPTGRHFAVVRVRGSTVDPAGGWHSQVEWQKARLLDERGNKADLVGKRVVHEAATSGSLFGVLVGLAIEGGYRPLPAELYLDDSGQLGDMLGWFPPESILGLWVDFDSEGVAIPSVVLGPSGFVGPDPVLLGARVKLPDVALAVGAITLPHRSADWRAALERKVRSVPRGGHPVPTAVSAALERARIASADGTAPGLSGDALLRALEAQRRRGLAPRDDGLALGVALSQAGRHGEAREVLSATRTPMAVDPDLDLALAQACYLSDHPEEAWPLLDAPLAAGSQVARHVCNEVAARLGVASDRCAPAVETRTPGDTQDAIDALLE